MTVTNAFAKKRHGKHVCIERDDEISFKRECDYNGKVHIENTYYDYEEAGDGFSKYTFKSCSLYVETKYDKDSKENCKVNEINLYN